MENDKKEIDSSKLNFYDNFVSVKDITDAEKEMEKQEK